jgi:peptide/nickel transport system substrate-binding protein
MKRTIALFLALILIMCTFGACAKQEATPAPEAKPTAPAAEESAAPAEEEPATTVNKDAVFVGGWPYSTVPTGHFNMFVSNAIELKFFRELYQLPLATYVAATDTYEPMLATSWEASADNTTFTVTLRNDVTWLSGDAFTAKDVWTTFMMYNLVGNTVWNYIKSVNVVSDTVVEFAIETPTSLLLRYVMRKPIVDYKTYGEYADRVQALLDAGATTDSAEWQELVNDFNTFRPEFVNATGPYYLDPANVTESSVELLRNESSFLADTVNFAKVVVYNGDVAALTPLVLNGEVDFLTHQFPTASMQTFESMGYTTLQVAGVDGIALYFNEAIEPFNNQLVRQAIAYVIDRQRVGDLALPDVSRGTKYLSGLGDTATEKWCDPSKLINYSVDTEKAAALLTEAGLTNKDGQWYLANGKQFAVSLQCPSSWSDASTAASEIAQQLTAFGIKTTFEGIDSAMRQTNITEGNFEMALSFFGTSQPHPYFAYETPLVVSNANAPKGLGYSMVQETASCGTVDLNELLTASTAGWDLDAQKAAIEQIIYVVNETVPIIPIYTKYSKYISSNGLRTNWGENDILYQNSAGDDSFVIIKILNGELSSID